MLDWDPDRNLREAYADWDEHVAAEHRPAHYAGQIGAEATPAEYVDNLIACTREWVRVLKPSGSIWVNLGDSYSGQGGGGNGSSDGLTNRASRPPRAGGGAPAKSLRGLPWRYALRCIDDLGLILRAEVIWSKCNGLPESVQDRVRRSHETWFHFVRSPRYFSAVDTLREPHAAGVSAGRLNAGRDMRLPARAHGATFDPAGTDRSHRDGNPLGKLPGSVWEIATEPLKVPAELGVDHFAAFPTEWPRRIIQGWSPSGICTACGEGRRAVVERERVQTRRGTDAIRGSNDGSVIPMSGGAGFGQRAETKTTVVGEACACPDTSAPTRPSVVLDPFGGTGTTALVARALGRLGVSGDMSGDYTRLARWRTTDPGEIARAMQVPKPPKQADGQLGFFEVVA